MRLFVLTPYFMVDGQMCGMYGIGNMGNMDKVRTVFHGWNASPEGQSWLITARNRSLRLVK